MRYFVVADDGTKYGPADVETLQGWISEGRLLPTTLLEDEGSGARIAASAVQGLNFPAAPMSGQPSPGANPGAAPPARDANPYAAPGAGPTTGPFAQPRPAAAGPGPYETPPGQSPRYQGAYDDGSKDITISWVLGVIGLVLCCLGLILGPIGIVFANRAKQKGNASATAPLVISIIALVLSIAIWGLDLAGVVTLLRHPELQPRPIPR
jgi:hypothetical protein